MASKPKASAPKSHALDEEANQRLADCRIQKTAFELDMKEGYFFTAPLRARQINSMSAPSSQPLHDNVELQTSVGFELAQDFATEVVNTFMPQAEKWCERGPGMMVDDASWKQVKDQVAKDDVKIFETMKGGNLYPEIAKAFVPDIAMGTAALNIEHPDPSGGIVALAIPLRELEINLGPFGEIDDRFIVRHTKNRYVKALFPDVSLPTDIVENISKAPNDKTQLRWGYWRIWEEKGTETWQHVKMVGDRVVDSVRLTGEGCCPLIVMRFNPCADWAYGLGPLPQSLPELRQVDELEGQKIAHIELNLTPPIGYPDDGMAAISAGLEAGMAYPIRPGSEVAIKKLYDPGSPETGIYAIDDKVHRLRKLWFIDYPEQKGDTPPTLGQWLDELARAQRRIGTPGLPFWQEGPAKIFGRYKYLLEKAGVIAPLQAEGGKNISTRAYNPAQRAAEQQEIAMAERAIQMCGQAFPEEFKALIDGGATMKAILDKMRVTLLKFRPPDQVKAAVDQISKLLSPRVAPGGTAEPQQGVQ